MKSVLLFILLLSKAVCASSSFDDLYVDYQQKLKSLTQNSIELIIDDQIANVENLALHFTSSKNSMAVAHLKKLSFLHEKFEGGFEGSGGGLGVVKRTGLVSYQVQLLDILSENSDNSDALNRSEVINRFYANNRSKTLFEFDDADFFGEAIKLLSDKSVEFEIFNQLVENIESLAVVKYHAYIVSQKLVKDDLLEEKLQHPLAFYGAGQLVVNQKLYSLMSPTHKVALATHESLRHLNFILLGDLALSEKEIQVLTRYVMGLSRASDSLSNIVEKFEMNVNRNDIGKLSCNGDRFLPSQYLEFIGYALAHVGSCELTSDISLFIEEFDESYPDDMPEVTNKLYDLLIKYESIEFDKNVEAYSSLLRNLNSLAGVSGSIIKSVYGRRFNLREYSKTDSLSALYLFSNIEL